jgi:hypothetical protein
MNAQCGSGKVAFLLTRKSGQQKFEGESHRDGAPAPAQVSLVP